MKHIEKISDDMISIKEQFTRAHVTPLLWVLAGSIPVIAVLCISTSQNPLLIPIIVLALLLLIILMSRQTKKVFNLADRTIRKTWKIGAFERHAMYSFDDITTVEVKDKSRMIEGYSLPVYTVQLSGKNNYITVYSTDDPEEAKVLCREISASLKRYGLSAGSINKLS